MSTERISPKKAANEFLKRIELRSYYGTIDSTRKFLEEGPAGRKKRPNETALHEWYQGLDNQSRSFVLSAIRRAVRLSVFSSLVILDNDAAGYPIENQYSDFAIYVQTYKSDEDMYNYSPQTAIRFNRSYSVDQELHSLHDEFLYMLQDHD